MDIAWIDIGTLIGIIGIIVAIIVGYLQMKESKKQTQLAGKPTKKLKQKGENISQQNVEISPSQKGEFHIQQIGTVVVQSPKEVVTPKVSSSEMELQNPKFHLHETIVKFVLQALEDTFFRDRNTLTIANKINIDEPEVFILLENLAKGGYVEPGISNNQPIWSITSKGEEYLNKLKGNSS